MLIGTLSLKLDNMDRRINKKSPEELQAYLAFKRKGYRVPSKKGKGSYSRKKFKNGEEI